MPTCASKYISADTFIFTCCSMGKKIPGRGKRSTKTIVTESIGSSKKQTKKRVLKRTRGVKRTHIQKKKTAGPKDVAPTKGGSGKSKKYESPATVHKHKQLDLSTTLVKMWEQFRKHTCSNRAEILQNILTIIKGRIKEFAFKHHTARVLQTVLKYGNNKQRLAVYDELKDSILELSKCKYSKFLVKKFLIYCPKQREEIMSFFYGQVRRLIRHTEAASLLESAYNDYANAHQREALTREFYGVITVGNEKQSKVKRLKETITPLLNKETLKHSIVHKPLLDYLLLASEEDRTEMIELLRERLVELLHTKEGSRVAMHCVWHGTAKDRKVIVKSFKTFVKKIAMEEHGHYVLLAMFDSIDDTVLVKKVVISELSNHLSELVIDKYGRRVLLYLLCPRNPLYFSPSLLSVLAPGDGNPHSKKPEETRRSELHDAISPSLVELTAANVSDWIRDKQLSQFLLAVVQHCGNDVTAILENTVTLLEQPFDEKEHVVSDACGHAVIRKLLSIENDRLDTNSVFLADLIVSRISEDNLISWATINRGAFVLTSLAASKVDGVSEKLKTILQPHIMEQWRTSHLKGHEALLRELANLT